MPLNELNCIEQDDFPFGGNWHRNFINYITINLFLCEDGAIYNSSDPKCSGIENLYKHINTSISFDIYYPIVEFQPTNYKTPLTVIYGNYFYRLSAFSHQLEKLYLREHIFSDVKSIIINNYKNTSCWRTNFLWR